MSQAAKAAENPTVKATVEKELVKTLRKTGFPSLEAPVCPSTTIPKVVSCLERRMGKIDECLQDVKKRAGIKEKPNWQTR